MGLTYSMRPRRDAEGNDVPRERLLCVPSDGKEGLGTPSQPLCWGGQGRPPSHWAAPWASRAPGEFGLARKQPGVSCITSVTPETSPFTGASDHPRQPLPQAPT